MAAQVDLLVIGAGPYAYSAAAFARDNGIDTHVVGRPMAFWREHMPADMFLRSGPDWHLDAGGEYTFEAYFEDQGLRPRATTTRSRSAVFLDYTDWFRAQQGTRCRPAPGHRPVHGRRGIRRDDGGRYDDHRGEGAGRTGRPALRATCPPGTPRCRRRGGGTPATSSPSTTSPTPAW